MQPLFQPFRQHERVVADASDETALEITALIQAEEKKPGRRDAFQFSQPWSAGGLVERESQRVQMAQGGTKTGCVNHRVRLKPLAVLEQDGFLLESCDLRERPRHAPLDQLASAAPGHARLKTARGQAV